MLWQKNRTIFWHQLSETNYPAHNKIQKKYKVKIWLAWLLSLKYNTNVSSFFQGKTNNFKFLRTGRQLCQYRPKIVEHTLSKECDREDTTRNIGTKSSSLPGDAFYFSEVIFTQLIMCRITFNVFLPHMQSLDLLLAQKKFSVFVSGIQKFSISILSHCPSNTFASKLIGLLRCFLPFPGTCAKSDMYPFLDKKQSFSDLF